ncbi:MAG: RNA polymerase sigma-70 factor [Bacteroidota bacterium]
MNKEAFKVIFDQHYDQIRNFLYYKLADIDMAEDIAQEVFIKAWNKRDKIVMGSVKSLLFTIANNLAINHFQSAKKKYEFKLQHEDKPIAETPEYQMEEQEFAEKLNETLNQLPENQKVVFLMNRIDDLTYQQISDRLGIGVKAVEKRMHRALKFLRERITQKI